ncbi:hypothetical protein N7457_000510 [Penicillium paradoxum]|uniref:uncharacterized protein n=1 Tax=Penicillium paradoxum TaxID=176176 RepID=UPI002549B2BD|nr:uncharacterized protein N7457_000510 [Penicillium paradoxum]KAJ5793911.1 hypothetical protein N7457_000510 [Penicillium paradoxum]
MGCFHLSNIVALIGVLLVGPTVTLAAALAAAPQPKSNGICYKYVVQAGETCPMIAQAHSITTADIETYNARSYAWYGCKHILQGSFICLSTGEPMMPVALPHAVCGPQVPGTMRPNNWSELGSMNPCSGNQCCSSMGLCGTTPDFCNSAAQANPASPASQKAPTAPTTKAAPNPVASSATSSTKKAPSTSATKAAPTTSSTTSIKTTSTTKTTLTTKSTKTSQVTTSTSTSTGKVAKTPWSITMYSKKDCEGDYYVLQGHNLGYSNTCLNLHGGLSSKYTETGVSCKWFTNGGSNYANCDAGTLEAPESWVVQVGLCTVYNAKNCDPSDGHANAYMHENKKPCRNRGKFDTPKFLSMTCYTENED